jgi:hypothetical protein
MRDDPNQNGADPLIEIFDGDEVIWHRVRPVTVLGYTLWVGALIAVQMWFVWAVVTPTWVKTVFFIVCLYGSSLIFALLKALYENRRIMRDAFRIVLGEEVVGYSFLEVREQNTAEGVFFPALPAETVMGLEKTVRWRVIDSKGIEYQVNSVAVNDEGEDTSHIAVEFEKELCD